jgi:hypothetical protein
LTSLRSWQPFGLTALATKLTSYCNNPRFIGLPLILAFVHNGLVNRPKRLLSLDICSQPFE